MLSFNTVRPLPVPELPVKSDGIYRATLWLRNPGLSRRLHNQPCRVLMILGHDVTGHVHCMFLQIDFPLYPRVPQVFWIFSLQQKFYPLPTYSNISDYLICIRDYIRYILYSTPLDPSIFIVDLTVLLLRFFERESVQQCFHTPKQDVLTSQRIPEDTIKTQVG